MSLITKSCLRQSYFKFPYFSKERTLTKETRIYLKFWNLYKRKELVLASALQNLQSHMEHQYGFAVQLA